MRILDSLWRWGKLGLFIGWGTGLAVLSACSSATVRPDSHQAPDSSRTDRPRTDGPRTDGLRAAAPRDAGAPDKRGWDVPLE